MFGHWLCFCDIYINKTTQAAQADPLIGCDFSPTGTKPTSFIYKVLSCCCVWSEWLRISVTHSVIQSFRQSVCQSASQSVGVWLNLDLIKAAQQITFPANVNQVSFPCRDSQQRGKKPPPSFKPSVPHTSSSLVLSSHAQHCSLFRLTLSLLQKHRPSLWERG